MRKILRLGGALVFGLLVSCAPYPLYKSPAPPPPPPAPVAVAPAPQRPSVPVPGKEGEDLAGADSAAAGLALDEVPPPTFEVYDLAKISTKHAYQVGRASYYGKRFNGRRTAKGDRYDITQMTAAHRVLPLGTVIKVTNLENGRVVEVEVNDRGPFSRRRILDLSLEAAKRLDMVRKGSAKVMIEIVKAAQ